MSRPRTAFPLILILLWLPLQSVTAARPADFEQSLAAFAEEVSRRHGLDAATLQKSLAGVTYHQSIIDAISRPAEKKPWYKYRPIFVTRSRAQQGVEFWNSNREILTRAYETYGVPPEIIVAIIGVETRYGRHAGRYGVLDSLSTLAFGYPKRARFFRKELEQFILLSHEEQIPLGTTKGSYAGAMGKPQFIPSSYRTYAVDFDKDGRRDLFQSNQDVIGSVAAYLSHHGWQPGEAVVVPAYGVTAQHTPLVEAGMKPSHTIAELGNAGIQLDPGLDAEALSSLIRLREADGDTYWAGLNNFYAITRYNHSNLYAMAVYQLSREILKLNRGS